MKARLYSAVAFIALVAALAWWWQMPKRISSASLASSPTPSAESNPPQKPARIFHFNHLPTSPEERAMLDWWMYMDKHDSNFQWKTPISFYGKVIDQYGLPVSGADVLMAWSSVGETPERKVLTDAEGRFEITGIQGKGISVTVNAAGYKGGKANNQSFEYSAFWEPHFNVPDKEKPVLFRLWKFENAEPMHFWTKLKKMSVNGEKVWFNVTSGKFESTGDIAFSTKRGQTFAPHQFDWSFLIEAAEGGGIVVQNEEFMFNAPENGYSQSWGQDILVSSSGLYEIGKTVKFYLKTSSGRYAMVSATINQMGVPEAEVDVRVYVNPSGSRNLQYDASKRIVP